MSRPRLFLVPMSTELEFTIRPQLEEWADVASYDPVNCGDLSRDGFVVAGLAELDRLGCEELYIAADTFGTATAVRIAAARRDAVAGIALGHGCLSWDMSGERPPIRRELWEAMEQLMSRDAASFVRHGLTQITQGSYDEELSQKMVERVPADRMHATWAMIGAQPEPIGELLRDLDLPLLLAQHDGCLVFTEEGFEDALAAFPEARSVLTKNAPCAAQEFAAALRDFCDAG